MVPDPADRATIEEEHALELRTRDRERKLIKKIDETKKKTRELQDLQIKNDNKVIKRQKDEKERLDRLEAERQAQRKRKEKEKQ